MNTETGRMHRILQISDTHLAHRPGPIRPGYPDSDRQLATVLSALRQRESQPELLWLTGDLAEDPERVVYTRLLGMLDEYLEGWPLAALAGNHDEPSLLREAFAAAGHPVDSHLLVGDWLLIGLNSAVPGQAAGQLGDAELARLDRTLTAHPEHWAVIAVHHPVVPIGSAWMDRMGLLNAAELFAVLDRHPQVRACLFGHIHQDFRTRHQGIELLGCPSTCVQFTPGAEHFDLDREHAGYRVLELYPDGRLVTHIERVTAQQPEANA